MSRPLYVNADDVRGHAATHDQVAADLRGLMGSAGLDADFGPIAAGFTSALAEALPDREAALRAAADKSETVGKLARAAAELFEHGDRDGAEKLRAAAEALERSDAGSPRAAEAAPAPAPATGAVGAPDAAGQLAGQVGQQVGSLVGSMAQAVQGLAQGLTQLPQQIAQGVQGLSSSGKGGVESDDDPDADPDTAKDTEAEHQKSEADEKKDARPLPHTANDGARPAHGSGGVTAPAQPPAAKAAPPAQTRPQ